MKGMRPDSAARYEEESMGRESSKNEEEEGMLHEVLHTSKEGRERKGDGKVQSRQFLAEIWF